MRFKMKILVLFAVTVVLAGAVMTGYHRIADRFFPLMYAEEIEKYAKEEGLESSFIAAVINAESGFDAKAHSGVAKGLMQITDGTAEWICEKMGISYYEDMTYDAEVNIKMGCWYLGYLKKRYENIEAVLAAYNAGLGNVDKWLSDTRYSNDGKTIDNIPFTETRNYVKRVRRMMGIYQKRIDRKK